MELKHEAFKEPPYLGLKWPSACLYPNRFTPDLLEEYLTETWNFED